MPDADDFDVEYFRNLMRGNNPKDGRATPAEPPPPIAKKTARQVARPTASKGKGAGPLVRKKGGKR